jgi:hypothetical protein
MCSWAQLPAQLLTAASASQLWALYSHITTLTPSLVSWVGGSGETEVTLITVKWANIFLIIMAEGGWGRLKGLWVLKWNCGLSGEG